MVQLIEHILNARASDKALIEYRDSQDNEVEGNPHH
jgi:hypothetical protein